MKFGKQIKIKMEPPCCDKPSMKRGLWSEEEDAKMLEYVSKHGKGKWTSVPKKAGFLFFIYLLTNVFSNTKLLFIIMMK